MLNVGDILYIDGVKNIIVSQYPEPAVEDDPIQSLAYDPDRYPHFIELDKANG